jgi:hypothetical protein
MSSRREFLKAVGAGAATLAAGGLWPRPAAAAPLPQAYAFVELLATGAALPGGGSLSFLPGPVALSDAGSLLFLAQDSRGVMGVYRLEVASGELGKVLASGDTLPDGNTAYRIATFDTNHRGSAAVIANSAEEGLFGVHLARPGEALQQVAALGQQVGDTDHRWGGEFTDLVLHQDDDLLVVAHYTTQGLDAGRAGLFHLPGSGRGARLLMTTPSLVHGADGQVADLGLSHLNSGDYVIQAVTVNQDLVSSSAAGGGAAAPVRTALVTGSTGRAQTSGFATLAWPQYPRPGGPPPAGEIVYGPRMDHDSQAAYVVHVTDERLTLVVKDRTVISTGDLAPAGWPVFSMSPPNVGAGLYFVNLYGYTDQNEFQLVVYNGSEMGAVVTMLDDFGGRRMVNLLWGFHTDQVDPAGRLAFVAEWDDQSTQSLMLAVPA